MPVNTLSRRVEIDSFSLRRYAESDQALDTKLLDLPIR